MGLPRRTVTGVAGGIAVRVGLCFVRHLGAIVSTVRQAVGIGVALAVAGARRRERRAYLATRKGPVVDLNLVDLALPEAVELSEDVDGVTPALADLLRVETVGDLLDALARREPLSS